MLPTFFVIGAAKAGTTSLSYYLGLHPEIHMSPIKEPHFFAGPENGFPYPRHRVERLEDYERLFETDRRVRGEASPSYTQYARRTGVPERIKDAVPDAKFIYIVRDPIARAISHFAHWTATGAETRSLRDALEDAESLTNIYTCGGRYGTQLERYLSNFPADRVLVIDQHELRRDRAATLRRVYSFLDVDPAFWSKDLDHELGRGALRRGRGSRYAQVRRAGVRLLSRLPKPVYRQLRGAVSALETRALPPVEPPALDPDLRERLRELYTPEVARLRALTGHTFDSWSL
jgi:hypothetical protein